ncbi:hypothetical protein [Enterococcus faecalis]|uniref:hypothetical protein n=1 Tax=Enterococcus faecalis TaxID=1351 RepID=UPI001571D65D|nr:hypothetical protein [Enterococcus faecalis]NSQ65135.1 hypothetical protein [Enterococcus faecalis]
MKKNEVIVKYCFIVLFIGAILLSYLNIISQRSMYFILGALLLIVAYLILMKGKYFFSNLISSSDTNKNLDKKLGIASGIISLIIGIILILVSFSF